MSHGRGRVASCGHGSVACDRGRGGVVAPLWYRVRCVVLPGHGCCMAVSSHHYRLCSVIIGRGRSRLSLGRGDVAVAAVVCLVVVC
jgi:hypothetical protein